MFYLETLERLIKKSQVESTLFRGSPARYAVRCLQIILYKLGFGEELGWVQYMADGDYGNGTTRALKAFLERNGLPGDGEKVSQELAEKLHAYVIMRDDLRRFREAIAKGEAEDLYSQEFGEAINIQGLQRMLNALGYGKELRWDELGAQGLYSSSTIAAVNAFGKKEGLRSDGTSLSKDMLTRLKMRATGLYGGALVLKDESAGTRGVEIKFQTTGNRIFAWDEFFKVRMVPHQKGVYVVGDEKAEDFVEFSRNSLQGQGMTDSALRVMLPVSANEGALDAINTWDNAFLSFGMFQWTLGTDNGKGELAALLKKIKQKSPGAYRDYYASFGLEVVENETNEVYGLLSLNGKTLRSPSEKEQLRTNDWAFRFWRAGLDPEIQEVEIRHAFERIYTFYQHSRYKVLDRFFVSDLVTSEYGVALLLDHHVNRPAHPRQHLGQALQQTGLESKSPSSWTTADERKLLESYLAIRANSSMTKPNERAETTKRYLEKGRLSDERGSFEAQVRVASRSLEAPATPASFFPRGLKEKDYPLLGESSTGESAASTTESVAAPQGNWFVRLWKAIFG